MKSKIRLPIWFQHKTFHELQQIKNKNCSSNKNIIRYPPISVKTFTIKLTDLDFMDGLMLTN